MNNGNGISPAATSPVVFDPSASRVAAAARRPARKRHLLYKMIGVAVAIHLVLILSTSRGLFVTDPESPEQVFQKAESAMDAGHYLDAMDLYQQVLDKQPKLPPVFERAAERHRAADKLAKAQAAKLTATKPTADPSAHPSDAPARTETSQPVKVTAPPAAKPEFEVPPELRGK
jgi:hypothetical protein